MLLVPAIDIKEGKCVRLYQGLEDRATDYGSPVEMAKKWESQGAKLLHIVDLDGAFKGGTKNREIIEEIIKKVNIPIQLGGGIRDYDTARDYLQMGVYRVIFGTAAITSPKAIKNAVEEFKDRIVVGIDGRNGKVALKGWVEQTKVSTEELANEMENLGVKWFVWTDISTDGTLSGPNIEGLMKFLKGRRAKVIASGGIGKLQDLINLKNTGVSGAIIGKALYNGNFTLKDAREALGC